ncbi:FAS1 domain-containing protein SELMODRAFT_448915-like [Bidens hawaiensis]|uniref:FAS1 domain-containing protein SELMODRAFT_448915-like n=1 Tax=Bidens hawaiensis TaxID=980011 RepID=UPI00404A421A
MSTHLFFLLLLFTAATTTATTSPPAPSPSPQPQLSPEYIQQLKNIIDALIGAGDFAAWANILFNPINTTIPTAATIFLPSNDALSRLSGTATGAYSFDPLIIPYHVIPQRLTFSQLQLFKPLTRIPTLLPSKTILITDNAPGHFTLDDSLVMQPDVYTNAAVCVHGVENVLDYKVYGDAGQQAMVSELPPPPMPQLPPADDETVTVDPEPEVVSSVGSGLFVGFLIRVVAAAVFGLVDFLILVI